MILTQKDYDQMINEDPFPFYKYNRLPEEEKTLSYLTTNPGEHENLAFAIARFGPQRFRGTFGTRFEPPGFERHVNRYNAQPSQGFVPPLIAYPAGLQPSNLHQPGLAPHVPIVSSAPVTPVMPHLDISPSRPSLHGSSHSDIRHSENALEFYNSPPQRSQSIPIEQWDRATTDIGSRELPPVRYTSPTTPAQLLLIVGGESSDDDDDKGKGIEDSRESELDRVQSGSSDESHESIEMTSKRVSLASSRTTPPKTI